MKRIHLPARSAASRCLTLGPTVVTTLALLAPPAFAGINQDLDDITLSGLAFTSGNGGAPHRQVKGVVAGARPATRTSRFSNHTTLFPSQVLLPRQFGSFPAVKLC